MPQSDELTQSETFNELRAFYDHGPEGPSRFAHASEKWPTPALLKKYRDLTRIRYDYPLCLAPGERGFPARPLTGIVDEVISAAADDSDEGRRLERRIFQLEAAVKQLADEEPGARLSVLWNRAADELSNAPRLSREERQMLKQDLNVARGALTADGELVPCTPAAAGRIFRAALEADWLGRSGAWREELDRLIGGLREILAADFSRSPEAQTAEHLEAAAGSEDSLDFEAMSSILRASDLGKPIPETRRRRIENALEILETTRPLYDGRTVRLAGMPETSIGVEVLNNDCVSARDHHDKRLGVMAEFFKAARIAALETANRYHENTHDAFFAGFGAADLADGEKALCPPLAISLDSEFLSGSGKADLFDVLVSGIPVKILAGIDDLLDSRSVESGAAVSLGWGARIAAIAAALGEVYVLQSPVSDPAFVQTAMTEGIRYPGAAVFVIYASGGDRHAGLSTYHAAAAATESRIFPAFTCDPGKSAALAHRIDVSRNPHSETKWSRERFNAAPEGEDENAVELAFTPADFLFCDTRLASHFWRVPRQSWHADMVPFDEFLELDEESSRRKVPFITAVTPEDEVTRVVPTRAVLDFTRRCGHAWRIAQEMGGIHNSFAEEALSLERGTIEEERTRQEHLARERYDTELGRNVGDLTQEIIRRIVDQIVSGGTAAAGAAPAGASVVAAAVSSGPAAETKTAGTSVSPEPEEEADLSLDEPYIDTPLCTSCNECTNLNKAMFAYNSNKQAFIKDSAAGTFRELVTAAEKCPVHIIHPGKPKNPDEPGLDELVKRASRYN